MTSLETLDSRNPTPTKSAMTSDVTIPRQLADGKERPPAVIYSPPPGHAFSPGWCYQPGLKKHTDRVFLSSGCEPLDQGWTRVTDTSRDREARL